MQCSRGPRQKGSKSEFEFVFHIVYLGINILYFFSLLNESNSRNLVPSWSVMRIRICPYDTKVGNYGETWTINGSLDPSIKHPETVSNEIRTPAACIAGRPFTKEQSRQLLHLYSQICYMAWGCPVVWRAHSHILYLMVLHISSDRQMKSFTSDQALASVLPKIIRPLP